MMVSGVRVSSSEPHHLPQVLSRFEGHVDCFHDPIRLGQNLQDALIVLHLAEGELAPLMVL